MSLSPEKQQERIDALQDELDAELRHEIQQENAIRGAQRNADEAQAEMERLQQKHAPFTDANTPTEVMAARWKVCKALHALSCRKRGEDPVKRAYLLR
jgi:hypothetical protein